MTAVMLENNQIHILKDEERCLLCNSILKIIYKIPPNVGDEINSISKKQEKKADNLMKSLCNIFTLPYKLQLDDDVEIAGGEGDGNFIYLEPCKTSPCCSICRTYVDEFFRTERQINELIRQMSKLKHGIGSLIVDTFSATSFNIKNYSLKKSIYEAWFPKARNESPVPTYQRHSQFINDGLSLTPTAGSRSKQKRSTKSNLEPVSIPLTIPNPLNVSNFPETDNIEMDNCSSVPSPSSVGRGDFEMEVDDANETAQLIHNLVGITAEEDVIATQQELDKSETASANLREGVTDRRRLRLPQTYICSYCDKTTTNKGHHLLHLRTHTGEKPFACLHCARKFVDPRNKKHHELSTCKLRPQEDKLLEDPPKSLQKTKTKRRTLTETRRHRPTEGDMYDCIYCEKQCDTIRALERHVDQAHKGQHPFKCVTCDRTFADYGNKLKHQRTHDTARMTGEPQFECDICGKKYHLSHTLYHHRRYVHLGVKYMTGNGNHTCEICGKSYLSPQRLKRHKLNVHEGKHLKLFNCKICCKPCPSPSEAKKHEETHKPNRTHEILFQYKCSECPKHLGFSQKAILRQHYEETHPEVQLPEFLKNVRKRKKRIRKQFQCPECPAEKGAIFYNTIPFKRHIQKHHTGDNPPPYLGPRNKKQVGMFGEQNAKTTRRTKDSNTESSDDEQIEIELDDSNTDNTRDSSSESEVEEQIIKSIANKSKTSRSKSKPVESLRPSTVRKATFQSQRNSEFDSLGNNSLDPRINNNRPNRPRKRRNMESVRISDTNSNPIELKSLKIHLTRIEEEVVPAAEIEVKEEITDTESQPPFFTISNVCSVAKVTENIDSRSKAIAVMSLSKIASFINPTTYYKMKKN